MVDLNFNDFEMYRIKDAVLYYAALHPDLVEFRSICERLNDYCDRL